MKRNLIHRVHDVENMYFQTPVLYEFKKDTSVGVQKKIKEIKRW